MPELLRKLQLHLLKREGGDRLMANLLAMIPIHGLDAVLIAVELAFESGLPSTEHIINIISRLQPTGTIESVNAPVLAQPALANVERYDTLLVGEVHE